VVINVKKTIVRRGWKSVSQIEGSESYSNIRRGCRRREANLGEKCK
jgi:hypothetical protein